jgi:hypothetical protein
VAEGNCSAFFGPTGGIGGIRQLLSTVAGQSYAITFSFLPDGLDPSSFSAIFDGITLINLVTPPAGPYQQYSFLGTASSVNTTLEFDFYDVPGYLDLDGVSVEEAAVPEPTSLLLLGSSLAGIALAFGKRAKNKI